MKRFLSRWPLSIAALLIVAGLAVAVRAQDATPTVWPQYPTAPPASAKVEFIRALPMILAGLGALGLGNLATSIATWLKAKTAAHEAKASNKATVEGNEKLDSLQQSVSQPPAVQSVTVGDPALAQKFDALLAEHEQLKARLAELQPSPEPPKE